MSRIKQIAEEMNIEENKAIKLKYDKILTYKVKCCLKRDAKC